MKVAPVEPNDVYEPPLKETAYVYGAGPTEMVPLKTALGVGVQSKSSVKTISTIVSVKG